MTRTIRTMLGVTAAGLMALGFSVFGSPADASTDGTTAQHASVTDFYEWGPYYSRNHKALSSHGTVAVDWDEERKSNEVAVSGRLYDLDDRHHRCAFVKFKVLHLNDHHWSGGYHKKWCGDDAEDYFDLSFTKHDVDTIKVQVCRIGESSRHPSRCGHWHPIYSPRHEQP